MNVYGSQQLVEDVQKNDLCIGCGACVDLCPYFKNYKGKTSMLFPCTLEQGRCYAHCPKAELDLDELAERYWGKPYEGSPLGEHREVLAARAGQNAAGVGFQGGGTVSALIAHALKTGSIDGAVLTDRDGFQPKPRLVDQWEDVASCASSKFMAAPTLAAMNRAARDGYRRLGVVGTPCQTTSVAMMRLNPLSREDFIDPVALSVGLFCNWALDNRQLAGYLSEHLNVSSIRSMDIPPPPANILIVETDNGRLEFPLEEIRPLIPHTCFICPDMTSEWSDVSVGMFEGRPGWNTLIVRTERGAEFVDRARSDGFLETEPMPEDNAAHLSHAAFLKKQRAMRTAIRREVINNDSEDKRSALRIRPDVVNAILAEE